jgi:hypothetical protein
MVCDTFAHETHPVVLLHTGPTARNLTRTKPLPLVDNICVIAEIETEEDAIIIAQNKIACLGDMSLEGDLPDNVSDNGKNLEEALFTGS